MILDKSNDELDTSILGVLDDWFKFTTEDYFMPSDSLYADELDLIIKNGYRIKKTYDKHLNAYYYKISK